MINIALFIKIQYNSNESFIQHQETYSLFEDEYSNKNIEDVLSDIISKEGIFETSYQINGFMNGSIDEALKEENTRQLEKTNPKDVEDYINSIYYDNNEYIERDSYILSEIKKECISIEGYSEYILSIATKAREMVKNPMFSKTYTFVYRNIIKTVEDFKGLEDIKLELGNEKGIVAVTDYHIVDLFVITILFLLCYYLFMEEREKGLIQLLKTSKKGRHHTVITKLIVLQVVTLSIAILFYGSIMLVSGKIYGYGNLSRMVQSMSVFRECEFRFSVAIFLGVFLLTKIATVFLVSVIIGSIFIVANCI